MIYVHIFGQILLFGVILILLRQMNRDRAERSNLMDRYENLAMRVRVTQLEAEMPGYTANMPAREMKDPLSSVYDVEGS